MIEETGFSRSALSTLYAAGSGASAVMVSLVSRMADRYGPRRVLLVAGSALGAVCLLMATAQALAVLLIAFAALRAIGQGSLPVNGTLLVAQWFSRYRARAIAVMSLGFAVATAVLPPMSRLLIDNFGWREAYAVLGLLVWLLILPGTFFLVRNTPEEVGLLPDGEPVAAGQSVEARRILGPDTRKVFTSASFWALALPLATPSLVVTAMIFHQTGIFAEQGLSANTAGAVFVPFAIASAASAVIGGFLVDRYGPRRVFVGAMVLLLIALGWLQFVDTIPGAVIYAVILGASGALSQNISGVIWGTLLRTRAPRTYSGLRHDGWNRRGGNRPLAASSLGKRVRRFRNRVTANDDASSTRHCYHLGSAPHASDSTRGLIAFRVCERCVNRVVDVSL